MPELPEVETVRRGLSSLIVGKQIKVVRYDWPKSFPNDEMLVNTYLVGSTVLDIKRRAKLLIINLSSGYSLIIHLKMTGQLVYRGASEHFGGGHPSNSLVGKLPDSSTRVTIDFTDGSKLYFNDQRKFGWMKLTNTAAIAESDLFKKIGPEPLSPSFSFEVFKGRLTRRPNSSIKPVLLDQTIIAGVGNIYSDEGLWAAKIHPLTKVSVLRDKQIELLRLSLIEVLKLSIKSGGSTDRNYVDAEGRRGSYLKLASVFRREGQICPRCGTEIIKIRVAGRGTHLCPVCQKLPKADNFKIS